MSWDHVQVDDKANVVSENPGKPLAGDCGIMWEPADDCATPSWPLL